MVDANGKEVPWVDRDGRILTTLSERCRPAPGQRLFFLPGTGKYTYKGPELLPDWPERVRKGEFALPLYADLPSLPEQERRALWGLMVAQEGKTLVPVYHAYTQAGFDPDRDLLQHYNNGWFGTGLPQWRSFGAGGLGGGGLVVDWDLKTSLDGLYAAGEQVFVSGHHAAAAATGRYAGRHAARYALGTPEPGIDRGQVKAEKARVYAPLERRRGAMEWKELNAGVCRIMQDYCGAVRTEKLLTIGLTWLAELETGEARAASARNPHELMRLHEVFNIITNGRIIMEASRARKASNAHLGFSRADHSEVDPAEEQQWIFISLDEGSVKKGELPLDYHGDLEENYRAHCLP